MRAEIIYLATCFCDYFQGFAGHVYNVSPYGTTGDVRKELMKAIHDEEIFDKYGDSVDEDVYKQLEESVHKLFDGLDLRRKWDSMLEEPDDEHDHETPWSYFGVLFLEE